ncbi:MAG: chromosomal replication initiator protein DnaA [Acidimicrobiales bacterium]
MTAELLWKNCSDEVRRQVSDATWRTWFEGARPVALDDGELVLSVPNRLAKERLETRYLAMIEAALAGIDQREDRRPPGERDDADPISRVTAVRLEVATDAAPASLFDDAGGLDDAGDLDDPRSATPAGPVGGGEAGPAAGRDPTRAEGSAGGAGTANRPRGDDLPLNPRYTFEDFVIGTSNRFAHAAALSVAETPAKSYNPLFLYGAAGLGKTHLLHAIAHYARQNYATLHVRYVSTEAFMNEFVDAIRTNATTAFKRRYRECDILLVDDVQFMENKEGLQEEFFHTFNSLHGAGRQIVISSDRPPRAIATLEDRLRSRFEWGLITDVQPPELETRLAILRKKAEGERTEIPDEVLGYIAAHVTDNIRELEGALIRVSAYASLNREQVTLPMAERVLSDLILGNEPRQITPKIILSATSKTFGFSVDELCGKSRSRPLVNARQISMYVFRDLTDFSYPAIAREFGNRDHTTVIHAVEKISTLMKERRQIFDQVNELIHCIKTGG